MATVGLEHYLTVAAALFVMAWVTLHMLAQMYRDPAKALEMQDVKPGQGL